MDYADQTSSSQPEDIISDIDDSDQSSSELEIALYGHIHFIEHENELHPNNPATNATRTSEGQEEAMEMGAVNRNVDFYLEKFGNQTHISISQPNTPSDLPVNVTEAKDDTRDSNHHGSSINATVLNGRNTSGHSPVVRRKAKRTHKVFKGSDNSTDEVDQSSTECNWSLVERDKIHRAETYVNRYFKKMDVTCHNCKEKGHLSKTCPKPKKVSVCLMCGREGHAARLCPIRLCFNCQRVGHQRDSCTYPRRSLFVHCKRCGLKGHHKTDCTDLWRQYHMTKKIGPINQVKMKPNKRVFCYICAGKGHWGHECTRQLMDKFRLPQLPFVAVYEHSKHNYPESVNGAGTKRRRPQKRERQKNQHRTKPVYNKTKEGPQAKKARFTNTSLKTESPQLYHQNQARRHNNTTSKFVGERLKCADRGFQGAVSKRNNPSESLAKQKTKKRNKPSSAHVVHSAENTKLSQKKLKQRPRKQVKTSFTVNRGFNGYQ